MEKVESRLEATLSGKETKTGKKWFDGRDIYAASFEVGNFPEERDGSFFHELSVDQIIHITGAMLREDGAGYPLPFATPTGQNVSVFADRLAVFVNVGETDRSRFTGWVQLEYVKP